MDWKTYTQRKRLQVDKWIENNNISSYEDVVKKCESIGVTPPEQKEVEQYFVVTVKEVVSAPTETTEESPEPAPPKRGRKKTTTKAE